MISESEINSILKEYLASKDGQDFLKSQGISINFYDENQLFHLAEKIKNDIIYKFLEITNHASKIDAEDYFSGNYVEVVKDKNKNGDDIIAIKFKKHALYRPSLWARASEKHPQEGFTGKGVNDIFALITNGTDISGKVYGYWTYYSQGMGYGAQETWTRAWLPRQPKPFIADIIKHYEAVNPGLKIEYPSNWM